MPIKSSDEIANEILTQLEEHTPFTNTAPGSRIDMLTRLISRELEDAYAELEAIEQRHRLSTSTDLYLNRLAELFGLHRLPGETDENFRYRISTYLESAFAGKREALRMKALESPLVKSVHTVPYTHGGGSFSLYIIPHAMEQMEQAIADVKELIADLLVEGVRENVTGPRILEVTMSVVAAFEGQQASEPVRQEARRQVQQAIKSYIDELDMGKPIIIAQLTQRAMESHPSLVDVQVRRLQVGSRPVLVRNVMPYWDEKFYVRHLEDVLVF